MSGGRIFAWGVVGVLGLIPFNWVRLWLMNETSHGSTVSQFVIGTIVLWALAGGLGFFLVVSARGIRTQRALHPEMAEKGHLFCTSCGHQGMPSRSTPGSILIEIVLWLCFIVPGLIYSIWRINKRHDTCSSCGSNNLIPANSPKAVAQKKQMNL